MRKLTFIFCLLSSAAHAECTPAPDCASIGYTETSCETTSLKCPFDTTKLKCMDCDSVYRYSCTGDNITSGAGTSCNGKYASCSCVTGATFVNGNCICDTSCITIGNIIYSDYTCSSCKIVDKTAVGIIAYWNGAQKYILSLERKSLVWSADAVDIPDLPNITSSDIYNDFNGKNNSQKIVTFYGTVSSDYATGYCYNYAPDAWIDTKGQWFLPALGELYEIIHKNWGLVNAGLRKLGLTEVNGDWHWSSTENAHAAWVANAYRGTVYTYGKNTRSYPVNCVLVL